MDAYSYIGYFQIDENRIYIKSTYQIVLHPFFKLHILDIVNKTNFKESL